MSLTSTSIAHQRVTHGDAGAGLRTRTRAGSEAVISAYVRDISRRSRRGVGEGRRSLARASCAGASESTPAPAEF